MYGDVGHVQEGDKTTVTVDDDTIITVSKGRRPHRAILHTHGHAEDDLLFLSSLDEASHELDHEFSRLTLVPRHGSIPLHVEDVGHKAVVAARGKLEQVRLPGEPMQRFLAKLPRHSYTFVVHEEVLGNGTDTGQARIRPTRPQQEA